MGRTLLEFLEGEKLYVCKDCGAHLTKRSELLSKAFQGRTGQAFLFNTVINVKEGQHEHQLLMTGQHVICSLSCKACNQVLGWKYIKAYETEQRYKVGKFILEKATIQKSKWN